MFDRKRKKIFLFADGSCGAGEDIGAWTCFLCGSTMERKLLYGVINSTTISRMELIPIIEGLAWLKKHWAKMFRDTPVKIYSDSEYVIKTMSGMYVPSKNMDLWDGFNNVKSHFKLEYVWYERNTLPYMSLCDSTCSTIRTAMKEASNMLFENYKEPEQVLPYANLPE